jgi:hypothetical protein
MSDEKRSVTNVPGKSTPSKLIKKMWHKAFFQKNDKRWVPNANAPSLKTFALSLTKTTDNLATNWLDNKAGALNKTRTPANDARVSLEAQATKAAKRKVKSGKSSSAAK